MNNAEKLGYQPSSEDSSSESETQPGEVQLIYSGANGGWCST